MGKPSEQQPKQPPPPPSHTAVKESKPAAAAEEPAKKPIIWDCGSSLYDSFELKSFEKQLDSAIHSRSLSMPHLSDRDVLSSILDPKPKPPSQPEHTPKKSSKISRSINRLLRSIFKPKQQHESSYNDTLFSPEKKAAAGGDGFYFMYDYEKSGGVLSTIPEVPEFDRHSPEINSFVKKPRAASDRFIFTPMGISCA